MNQGNILAEVSEASLGISRHDPDRPNCIQERPRTLPQVAVASRSGSLSSPPPLSNTLHVSARLGTQLQAGSKGQVESQGQVVGMRVAKNLPCMYALDTGLLL